jgi:2-polyprenyl-6-methoxyphenol hydroxylase-like FAD-dependent oxidoreductase
VASGVQPRPAGYAAWRGVARIGEGVVSRASETMGRGRRFGLVPLRDGRVYWFAVAAGGGADLDLQTVFASWHAPIADVLHATPRDERSYLPLHDLPKLPRWHSGSVVLAGDAAHAMTPNLGQGAAQAFEDVAVLARELDARPLPDALVAYEGARKRRAERIVRQSRFFGRVAQTTNPVLVWARDFAAARTPVALAERQFASILDPA